MFDYGAVIVCTSNRSPEDLSSGLGATRGRLIETFLEKLQERCDVVEMDVQEDYRVLNASTQATSSYFITDSSSSSSSSSSPLNSIWETYETKDCDLVCVDANLKVFGREIPVHPILSPCGGAARFHFNDLCGDVKPLGPSDYLVIAHRFHTVLLDDIPRLTNRNHARRLIWLVDALYVSIIYCNRCQNKKSLETKIEYRYERNVNLVCSAACEPSMLFREEISNVNDDAMRLESIGSLDETATGRFNPTVSSMDIDSAPGARESELFSGQADVFAFERCVSRLVEMSTEAYVVFEFSSPSSVCYCI